MIFMRYAFAFIFCYFVLVGSSHLMATTDDLENAYEIAQSTTLDSPETILKNINARRSSLASQLNETENVVVIRSLQIELEKLNFVESVLCNPENKKLLDAWKAKGLSYRGANQDLPRFKRISKSKTSRFLNSCTRVLAVRSLVVAVGLAGGLPVGYKLAQDLVSDQDSRALQEQINAAGTKKAALDDMIARLQKQVDENSKAMKENEEEIARQDDENLEKIRNKNKILKSENDSLEASLIQLELMQKRRVDEYYKKNYSGHSCFSAKAKVSTLTGEKPIVDIKVGDMVLAFNHEKQMVEADEVVKLIRQPKKKAYLNLSFSNGVQVEATNDHPFYLVEKHDYVNADKLKVGDKVRTLIPGLKSADSSKIENTVIVQKIDRPKTKIKVFNFSVKKNQNYFVHGILVHNRL